MPKKFIGENSKAIQARVRKAATKDAEHSKKQKEVEDSLWKDDDKHNAKKMQRKEENDRKKQQQLEKKAEAKALLEKEMGSIQSVSKLPASKVTRAQIQAETEKRNAAAVAKATPGCSERVPKSKTHIDLPLEENVNRLQPDEIANTVDEAIRMLSVNDTASDDKHPEKKLKAAYIAFEEKNLPLIKAENPSLRMSQLKQMLFKEWQKSSENPLNKPKSH